MTNHAAAELVTALRNPQLTPTGIRLLLNEAAVPSIPARKGQEKRLNFLFSSNIIQATMASEQRGSSQSRVSRWDNVMTNSPNGQPRLDAARSKTHAKAVKTRLTELGVDIKLSHAYEALASAHGFRNWATMSAGLSDTSGGSIKIAKEGRARYSFLDGPRSFGKDVSLTFQQCRNHIEVIGRRKRSHVMSSIVAQAVRLGAGAVYADASGTPEACEAITIAAGSAGRASDVRIIDFNAPASDKPLRYTPFSTCTGDEMAEMLAGFVDVEGEEGWHWKGRAKAMLSGICEILTWARDNGSVDVTAGEINSLTSLRDLIDFTDHEEYPDIPLRSPFTCFPLPFHAARVRWRAGLSAVADDH